VLPLAAQFSSLQESNMKFSHAPLLLATTLSLATLSLAQNERPTPPTNPPSTNPPSTNPSPDDPDANRNSRDSNNNRNDQSADQILLTWLLVDNENEVALAQFASTRATDAELKQFLQRMVTDHGGAVNKLRQAVGHGGSSSGQNPQSGNPNAGTGTPDGGNRNPGSGSPTPDTGSDPARRGEVADAGTRGRRDGMPQDASGVRMAGAFNHEQLVRDLGKKCLESAQKMLSEKQGAEFDRCVAGMMVGAHVAAADKLEVFQRHVSEQKRAGLGESLQMTKSHLEQVKGIAKRLDGANGRTGE
jgi:predicted outer membrane protein